MGTIAQQFESGEQSAQKGLFNNLVIVARIDGKLEQSELNLLGRLASNLSLTEEQVNEIVNHPDQYPMVPPVSREDRYERFIQFVEVIFVDGVVDASETALANKYGVALGFEANGIESITSTIIAEFKAGKSRGDILDMYLS